MFHPDRGEVLYYAHRFEEAIAEDERVMKGDPSIVWARLNLATALAAAGRSSEAIAAFGELLKVRRIPEDLGRYGAALVMTGRRTDAMKVIEELQSHPPGPTRSQVYLAWIYAGMGDKTKALDCLEKAYADREADVVNLGVEPAFDGLHHEPRFAALKQRLGL